LLNSNGISIVSVELVLLRRYRIKGGRYPLPRHSPKRKGVRTFLPLPIGKK